MLVSVCASGVLFFLTRLIKIWHPQSLNVIILKQSGLKHNSLLSVCEHARFQSSFTGAGAGVPVLDAEPFHACDSQRDWARAEPISRGGGIAQVGLK